MKDGEVGRARWLERAREGWASRRNETTAGGCCGGGWDAGMNSSLQCLLCDRACRLAVEVLYLSPGRLFPGRFSKGPFPRQATDAVL